MSLCGSCPLNPNSDMSSDCPGDITGSEECVDTLVHALKKGLINSNPITNCRCAREDCIYCRNGMCMKDGLRIVSSGSCASYEENTDISALFAEIHCRPFEAENPIVFIIRGKADHHKGELVALGFSLAEKPRTGVFGTLSSSTESSISPRVWLLFTSLEEMENQIDNITLAGISVEGNITTQERALCEIAAKRASMSDEELEAERRALTYPVRPHFLGDGYWNGKVYGYPGRQSVWVNHKQINITEKQEREIADYIRRTKHYEYASVVCR